MTSKLTPHVFKDTGRIVNIQKVSPFLAMELRKMFPEPEPPMQEVGYGEKGEKKVMEANRAHPDYIAAMQRYQEEFTQRLRTLIIKRGVVHELSEEEKADVAGLREFWQAEYGQPLTGSDKEIFVFNICIGTDGDTEDLFAAIMQRSQPTELDVAQATKQFQS